VELRCLCGKIP